MIQSTDRRQPLLFFIVLAIVGYHLEKTMRLLRRSTNRSIFWLLHKSGNADEPGPVPSIETNGSWKEQRLESTAGGVDLPFQRFQIGFHWFCNIGLTVGMLENRHLSASTRTESNYPAFESFPWLWGISKWLVESLPMILPIFLAFGKCHQKVMLPILNLWKFSLFHCHTGPRHQNHCSWSIKNHIRHVPLLRAASPQVLKSIRWASAAAFFK